MKYLFLISIVIAVVYVINIIIDNIDVFHEIRKYNKTKHQIQYVQTFENAGAAITYLSDKNIMQH